MELRARSRGNYGPVRREVTKRRENRVDRVVPSAPEAEGEGNELTIIKEASRIKRKERTTAY